MDLLDTGERRRLPARVLLTGAALALVAAGQATALVRPLPLPSGAQVEALPNGYSYGTDGDEARIGFQLRNSGSRTLDVASVGGSVPGLELADVVVSGEPFRFSSVGVGATELPGFALEPGVVVEVNLVYRVRRCADVPRDDRRVPVTVVALLAEQVLQVPLPGLPSESPGAGPDDEDPWQQVLVRDLCRSVEADVGSAG